MSDGNPINPQFLTSWKEIAAFLGKGVRTVQRWELTLGLPIIRPEGSQSNVVMARCEDLENWAMKGRSRSRQGPGPWVQKDVESKARMTEQLAQLRQRISRAEGLLQEVAGRRQLFLDEVQRFRSLYAQWNSIRAVLDKTMPRQQKPN
jgi:hypothetical protein